MEPLRQTGSVQVPFNSHGRRQSAETWRQGSPHPFPCFLQPLPRWAKHTSSVPSQINSKDDAMWWGGEMQSLKRAFSVMRSLYGQGFTASKPMFIFVSCLLLWTQITINTPSPESTGILKCTRSCKRLCVCMYTHAHLPLYSFHPSTSALPPSFAWK